MADPFPSATYTPSTATHQPENQPANTPANQPLGKQLSGPSSKKPAGDEDRFIQRGVYRPSPVGTSLFFALRALDIPLQYKLLTGTWSIPLLSRLGIRASVSPFVTTIGRTGLSPAATVLLGMSAGAAIKQMYWLVAVSREEFQPATAAAVAIFNGVFSTASSLLFVAAATTTADYGPAIPIPFTNSLTLPLPVFLGAILYTIGLGVETASEQQRLRFKSDNRNKGKICTDGLWGLARHVNYGAYSLWRFGYGLASGGILAGLVNGAWFVGNFVKSGIPELDGYMSGRYGEQWARYRREVKYVLFPGIF